MNYTTVKNPIWANAEETFINCEVDFDDLIEEFVPFTASANDTEEHTKEIFARCVAGDFGPIGAYVPPPPFVLPAIANKAEAERLLAATDWVNQPDVYDPANTPHLTNRDDFIAYRSQVRAIAVNPVEGDLYWPTEPTAVWSS